MDMAGCITSPWKLSEVNLEVNLDVVKIRILQIESNGLSAALPSVSNIEKFDSVPHSTHCYLKIL
jgi:hypothetical protein